MKAQDEKWNFETAIEMYGQARWMKDDLPDGQWDELKEIGMEFKEEFGKISEWPDTAKEDFAGEIQDCFDNW